jgi:hypothetical protein
VIGNWASSHKDAEKRNDVVSSSPEVGDTEYVPGDGGEFIVMVSEEDATESPGIVHVRRKVSVDPAGRA